MCIEVDQRTFRRRRRPCDALRGAAALGSCRARTAAGRKVTRQGACALPDQKSIYNEVSPRCIHPTAGVTAGSHRCDSYRQLDVRQRRGHGQVYCYMNTTREHGKLRERTDLRAGRSPMDVRGLVDRALLRAVLLDTTRVPTAGAVFVDPAGFIDVRDVARETTGLAGGVIRVACDWPHIVNQGFPSSAAAQGLSCPEHMTDVTAASAAGKASAKARHARAMVHQSCIINAHRRLRSAERGRAVPRQLRAPVLSRRRRALHDAGRSAVYAGPSCRHCPPRHRSRR